MNYPSESVSQSFRIGRIETRFIFPAAPTGMAAFFDSRRHDMMRDLRHGLVDIARSLTDGTIHKAR